MSEPPFGVAVPDTRLHPISDLPDLGYGQGLAPGDSASGGHDLRRRPVVGQRGFVCAGHGSRPMVREEVLGSRWRAAVARAPADALSIGAYGPCRILDPAGSCPKCRGQVSLCWCSRRVCTAGTSLCRLVETYDNSSAALGCVLGVARLMRSCCCMQRLPYIRSSPKGSRADLGGGPALRGDPSRMTSDGCCAVTRAR